MNRRRLLMLGLSAIAAACTDQLERTISGPSDERPAPAPAASPAPSPAPGPSTGPSTSAPSPMGGSAARINLATVVWLNTDVSGWRQTSTITNTSVSDSSICISHTMSGRWPKKIGVEGNVWVFVNLNGTWHAATYEWIRSGQVCKGVTRSGSTSVGRHTKTSLLSNWVPQRGEVIGLMVSTHARSEVRTVNERSDVVTTPWP